MLLKPYWHSQYLFIVYKYLFLWYSLNDRGQLENSLKKGVPKTTHYRQPGIKALIQSEKCVLDVDIVEKAVEKYSGLCLPQGEEEVKNM